MAHHSVYVIELDPAVLKRKKFREKNPNHDPRKPCVYVGLTGHPPMVRFEQHLNGIRACRYVKLYGMRLRPGLYEQYNPMTWEEGVKRELSLARKLRKKGYAVWQA